MITPGAPGRTGTTGMQEPLAGFLADCVPGIDRAVKAPLAGELRSALTPLVSSSPEEDFGAPSTSWRARPWSRSNPSKVPPYGRRCVDKTRSFRNADSAHRPMKLLDGPRGRVTMTMTSRDRAPRGSRFTASHRGPARHRSEDPPSRGPAARPSARTPRASMRPKTWRTRSRSQVPGWTPRESQSPPKRQAGLWRQRLPRRRGQGIERARSRRLAAAERRLSSVHTGAQ
jgi:hypothetical protein